MAAEDHAEADSAEDRVAEVLEVRVAADLAVIITEDRDGDTAEEAFTEAAAVLAAL